MLAGFYICTLRIYSVLKHCEYLFLGLRLIEPLLLVQEAVICAIYYDKRSVEDLNGVPFNVLEIENQVSLTLCKEQSILNERSFFLHNRNILLMLMELSKTIVL